MQPVFWSQARSSPTPSSSCLLQLLTPFRLETAYSPSLHIPNSNRTSVFSLTLHQSLCTFTVFSELSRTLPVCFSQTWRAVVMAHKLHSLCSCSNTKHISPTATLLTRFLVCPSLVVTNVPHFLLYKCSQIYKPLPLPDSNCAKNKPV